MTFAIYNFLCADRSNEFASWTRGLQKNERAKLNAKIDALILHGETLVPQVLSDTHVAGIRKLRVRGNVQLRPILCRGPHAIDKEYTFLLGAFEVGDRYDPREAPETGDARRAVVANDINRRCKHERVN